MEHYVSLDNAMLLGLISPQQLEAFAKANPDKANAIKQALEDKAKVDKDLKDRQDFLELLGTIELPDSPEGVLNIYNSFVKEVRNLTDSEKAEVLKSNPSITKELLEARVIDTGKYVWKGWEVNRAMTTAKASGITSTRQRKLAITAKRIDGDSLVAIGNFRTSKEACNSLGYETKGDSARRVLEAHSIVVLDYEGTDFLIKET